MDNQFKQNDLIGQSDPLLEILEHVSQVAPLSKPVLIIGERGTGKELIAQRLHYLSTRWDQAFIKLNCASLSESLLESELFGHESGAFTGAKGKHLGRFERADNGSLFLDELANTSGLIQEKLLRVIEYGEFERVGGSKTIQANVRLICAANEDLPTLAHNGKFRADLLDRLAFDVITLPPLRCRKDDILLLADHFAMGMVRQLKLDYFAGFTQQAKKILLEYHWPGNVRELKNVIERAVYRNQNHKKTINEIILDPFDSPYRLQTQKLFKTPSPYQSPKASPNENSSVEPQNNIEFPIHLKTYCEQQEQNIINIALEHAQFNQKKTAELLGLSYHQLRGILKKYKLLTKS